MAPPPDEWRPLPIYTPLSPLPRLQRGEEERLRRMAEEVQTRDNFYRGRPLKSSREWPHAAASGQTDTGLRSDGLPRGGMDPPLPAQPVETALVDAPEAAVATDSSAAAADVEAPEEQPTQRAYTPSAAEA